MLSDRVSTKQRSQMSLRAKFQKMARPMMMAGALGLTAVLPSDIPQPPTIFEQLTAKTCSTDSQNSTSVYVVLTGGVGRVPVALRHYQNHTSPSYLYVSGVDRDVNLSDVLTANAREDLIPNIGRSIFHDHAETTNANAIQSAMFLKDHCLQNVTFITSDYHMERARFVFQRALRNIDYNPNVKYLSVVAPPLTRHEQFEETIKTRAVKFFGEIDLL